MIKIGFIGAGKTGVSLGRYFHANGLSIGGYYSKTYKNALKAADYVESTAFFSCEEVVNVSDIIFITTPDGSIAKVAEELLYLTKNSPSQLSLKDKIVVHGSGAKSSDILKPCKEAGAYICSMHPAQAMSQDEESYKRLSSTFFTLEGDTEAVNKMKEILRVTGNSFAIIDPKCKSKYHCATAVCSNLVVSISNMAIDLLKECGFEDEEKCRELLLPLMVGNMQNIAELGNVKALTGPVERCDVTTVKSHLDSLTGDDREIYRLLSKRLISVAKAKNEDRNYDELYQILEEN